MLRKCQLASYNSLAAWESSTAIPPFPSSWESRGWGSWAQGCCYVPAADADGITGDGRWDPVAANGSYASGTPRRWVGVCETLGLRILHSVIKKPRGKEKDRGQFSQDMPVLVKGVNSLLAGPIPCFNTRFYLYFLPAPEGSQVGLMQTALWYLEQPWE